MVWECAAPTWVEWVVPKVARGWVSKGLRSTARRARLDSSSVGVVKPLKGCKVKPVLTSTSIVKLTRLSCEARTRPSSAVRSNSRISCTPVLLAAWAEAAAWAAAAEEESLHCPPRDKRGD